MVDEINAHATCWIKSRQIKYNRLCRVRKTCLSLHIHSLLAPQRSWCNVLRRWASHHMPPTLVGMSGFWLPFIIWMQTSNFTVEKGLISSSTLKEKVLFVATWKIQSVDIENKPMILSLAASLLSVLLLLLLHRQWLFHSLTLTWLQTLSII